jgi:hypothetical protein
MTNHEQFTLDFSNGVSGQEHEAQEEASKGMHEMLAPYRAGKKMSSYDFLEVFGAFKKAHLQDGKIRSAEAMELCKQYLRKERAASGFETMPGLLEPSKDWLELNYDIVDHHSEEDFPNHGNGEPISKNTISGSGSNGQQGDKKFNSYVEKSQPPEKSI